ncbi:MAG: hypothetical protein JWM09_1142, partial [Francisellaceae bacterium]|nr:hypothetical protein [Francisellaceae bacterium]
WLAESTAAGTVITGAALGALGYLGELPVFAIAGGVLLGTGAILSTSLLAAGLAAFLASLIDSSSEEEIFGLKNAIENNEVVIIAEIPEQKIDTITQGIKKQSNKINVRKVPKKK